MLEVNRQHSIYPLQFISAHPEEILEACRYGIRWVQLRIKGKDEQTVQQLALRTADICSKYDCTLIINDYPEIAEAVSADGVHLGKNDVSPADAREILGPDAIIGGTANTLDDMRSLAKQDIDYIGLGPFRFTTTKDNLSPVLGIEGYRQLMKQAAAVTIPVIAIGGILAEDVPALLKVGLHGVAVSSAISKSADPEKSIKAFIDAIDTSNEQSMMI